ncbi:hypothetical protein [Streptomyces sp. NPDC018584]|uniref:hypothetical protein n=1 Tax=unclassified Streptomyces TaxID=2593676 RepID=UPI0037AB6F18
MAELAGMMLNAPPPWEAPGLYAIYTVVGWAFYGLIFWITRDGRPSRAGRSRARRRVTHRRYARPEAASVAAPAEPAVEEPVPAEQPVPSGAGGKGRRPMLTVLAEVSALLALILAVWELVK